MPSMSNNMATDNAGCSLSRFMDGEFWELKQNFRKHIDGNSLFNLRFDLSLDESRQIAYERAYFLFQTPEIRQQFYDQASNERNFINCSLALGEVISTTDLSVGVKMGVMGWLFGGAVTNLGSEKHVQKWFQPLKDSEGRDCEMRFTGMFCMSERGHGSNVRGLLTEAHYDKNTQEFIIHTPCKDAEKIYIGNAMQGQMAAVFAQLYIDGQCKGPHCFLVPIRDENGLCPGISVVDLGLKEGLHGVDNGIVAFGHVRVPRENLLNRYGDVSVEGKYSTPISRDGTRFNAVLGALLGTRLALCHQALSALKVGLEIAIKYGFRRRQFGPPKGPEQLLMDYQTHQLRLMPRLATSLALTFATRHAGQMLAEDVYHRRDLVDNRPLQALAAGLKAFCTWEGVHGLQTCRECTGGMGYMEINRIASLKRDADVFVTFEGDNIVMLQQVTKELLVQYGKQFGGSNIVATLSAIKDNLVSKIKTSPLAVRQESVTNLRYVLKALHFKERELLRNLAARLLHKVSTLKEDSFKAWNGCLDHVIALAWCHVKRVTLSHFIKAVQKCPRTSDKATLDKFVRLFATHVMYEDRAWYLENNYMSTAESKLLRDRLIELCEVTKDEALTIVEAFQHPANCVQAPIAGVKNDDAPWAYYPDPEAPTKAKL